MPNETDRVIWCLVEGDPIAFRITAPANANIHDLKKLMKAQRENGVLQTIDAKNLKLFKLKDPLSIKPSHTLSERLRLLRTVSSDFADELYEITDKVSATFPGHPSEDHLYIFVVVPVSVAADDIYTNEWITLKHRSQFYNPSGLVSTTPAAGDILRANDSLDMLSMSDAGPVPATFVRECYISWFDRFLEAAKKQPTGKFALSSSPGCGKTTANNFMFKMAASDPFLCHKPILYQFKDAFYHFKSDTVYIIERKEARIIAVLPETFYVIDGRDADPVHSKCLTLFISSPWSDKFKDWHLHAKITPLYFPVWSLQELRDCRTQCYPTISEKVLLHRYERYGGIARYVFWEIGEPPSIEAVAVHNNARNSIRTIGEPSQIFPSSHMLLHLSVDENLHFQHVVLASRYLGSHLFDKYFGETFDKLTSLLVDGGGLAGHLFECYVHFLCKNERPLTLMCKSLEGDNATLELQFPLRHVKVFDAVPEILSGDTYYVPFAADFPGIDALTKDAGLQCAITTNHPIKMEHLVSLFPSSESTLDIVFIVPQPIAAGFSKQEILTAKDSQKTPRVLQFVAGLPLGIDTSVSRKRKKCCIEGSTLSD